MFPAPGILQVYVGHLHIGIAMLRNTFVIFVTFYRWSERGDRTDKFQRGFARYTSLSGCRRLRSAVSAVGLHIVSVQRRQCRSNKRLWAVPRA